MNKFLLKILTVILFVGGVSAQQVPFYNHNLRNQAVYNPAYYGFNNTVNAYLVRNQRFAGFDGGAYNHYLTVDGKMFLDQLGFGVELFQYASGVQKQLGGKLGLKYSIKLADKHHLALGATGGLFHNNIDMNQIQVMQQADPYMANIGDNKIAGSLDVGLLYHWEAGLRIGFAVPQVIGNKINYSDQNSRGYYRLARHMMANIAYDFAFLKDKSLVLTPDFLVRYTPGAPIQYDGSIMLEWKKLGWFSATYKSDYAVSFNLGFSILKSVQIGYSYEYVIGSLKNHYSAMNHEFMIGYTFQRKNKTEFDSTLYYENIRLKEEVERKNKQIEILLTEKISNLGDDKKDTTDYDDKLKNSVRSVSEDKFKELDETESPAGFYVVVGAFWQQSGAQNVLNDTKNDFPDGRIIFNERNELNYVILKYSTERNPCLDILKTVWSKGYEKAWVLEYK
jgi:type IX secretion system PorP/SprF family membrane protein